MTTEPGEYVEPPEPADCIHLCSMGCGNTYDFVVVTVEDSTTLFLCIPDFIGSAMMMVQAMTEPENEAVKAAVAAYNPDTVTPRGRRGKNPVLRDGAKAADDSDLFDEFEPDVSETE